LGNVKNVALRNIERKGAQLIGGKTFEDRMSRMRTYLRMDEDIAKTITLKLVRSWGGVGRWGRGSREGEETFWSSMHKETVALGGMIKRSERTPQTRLKSRTHCE